MNSRQVFSHDLSASNTDAKALQSSLPFLLPKSGSNASSRAQRASNLDQKPPAKKRKDAKWSVEDEDKLRGLVNEHPGDVHANDTATWKKFAAEFTNHSHLDCRDRWFKFLRPDLIKGNWAECEEQLLMDLVTDFGPQWKPIQLMFPHRSNVDLKNKYRSMKRIKEREVAMMAKCASSQPDV